MNDMIVVTGAAGVLGRAVVDEFRGRGAEVAALDRPSDALTELGRDPGVHPIAVDLVDPASVTQAWAAADAFGTPAALVTVAGGFAGGGLADVDPRSLDAMMSTNVATTLWSAQAAAARMREAGGGAIVTIGSRTGVSGPGAVAYAAAKAAVVRLTEVLADELRPDGIRVNAVLPSVIDTPANRSWMSADVVARAVSPAAVARVIAFLCSADAAPISGAAIPVYGDS